jgi:hypothetical protein
MNILRRIIKESIKDCRARGRKIDTLKSIFGHVIGLSDIGKLTN